MVRDILLLKLLCTDDLALRKESLNEFIGKYERWRRILKGNGLSVNVEKTKVMQLLYNKNYSKMYPCGVYGEMVRRNSVFSVQNFRSGFIFVVQICLGRSNYFNIVTFLSVRRA